ncbi:uncharacterized protein AB675_7873 [Cyphellophora attinorum]|uniref:GPI anchored cell wall protein n=1 Tax=Cyphellophora attinorum TaxID=1664694 RepID=A0A0N1NZM0_9EURO|nr:uncharacterized protein AB675_7873 [Phialophora attinorum]KPI41196.1 hypothetical protein AB675_7873 [Phialophora attinorum]
MKAPTLLPPAFFTASILFTPATALAVADTQPPACLLAAVNEQPSPANMVAICGTDAPKVQDAIQSLCEGSDKQSAAQGAFTAPRYVPSSTTTVGTGTASSAGSVTAAPTSGTSTSASMGPTASTSTSGSRSPIIPPAMSDTKVLGTAVVVVLGVLWGAIVL